MKTYNACLMFSLVALLLPGLMVSGRAQDTNAAATNQMVSDVAVVNILDTIRNYVDQKSTTERKQTMRLFDRDKAEIVSLKLEKVDLKDPVAFIIGSNNYVGASADFTEVTDRPKSDKYTLWFILRRERQDGQVLWGRIALMDEAARWNVKGVIIKSVNGKTTDEWIQNQNGNWKPTPITIVHRDR